MAPGDVIRTEFEQGEAGNSPANPYAQLIRKPQTLLDSPNKAMFIHVLQQDQEEALTLLASMDTEMLGNGDPYFRERLSAMANPISGDPKTKLVEFFRAYPEETRALMLWVKDEANKPESMRFMNFYAANGLLNERATRPHDNVFIALGMDVPEPLNRKRTQAQKDLASLQEFVLAQRFQVVALKDENTAPATQTSEVKAIGLERHLDVAA